MFGEIYKVIVVSASESSLISLETILENLTGCLGSSVVLVLQEAYKASRAQLKELLGSYANAQFVKDLPLKVVPGGIYILDSGSSYEITRECELVSANSMLVRDASERSRAADLLLRSLSSYFNENCIAVVLGGKEQSGAEGCFAIHNAGGLVVVQDPLSCQYDVLPNSVIARGVADIVVDVEDMADLLVNICKGHEITEQYLCDLDVMQVNRVMEILSIAYEVDFGQYKLSTVRRRIFRRMRLCNFSSVDEYAVFLEKDRQELHALYQDLLIGVTCFFRDKEAFAVCQKDILPGLIKAAANRQEFRIWDAACATGQEAYSLAILCHEITRELELNLRVKIVATDVDADSIAFAGRGIYSDSDLNNMPVYLRDRYFVQVEPDQYQIIQEIRQKVIFSQHNLLQSPPFTRMDMVCCRNLLIYLKGKTQARAVYLFHFALNTGGVLFLGPSETLGELETGFETIDRHWRFFRKKTAGKVYPRLNYAGFDRRAKTSSVVTNCGYQPVLKPESSPAADLIDCYQQLLSAFVGSGVLIDENNNIVQFFGEAQKYFNFKGPLNLNLLNVVTGELRLALSAGLRKMAKEKSDIVYDRVESVLFDGARQTVKIVIKRIAARHRLEMRFIGLEPVADITPSVEPAIFDTDKELTCVNQMLEEELAHVKKALINAMEELEANNEEYQAANEELTASNEELHATNEELHSVNEELFVVNSQYERKIEEVNQVNNDIKNLIDNMDLGVIFLDKELKIRYFSPIAEDLFHLQDQDIGRPIRHFRSRLVEAQQSLEEDCRSVVEGSSAIIRQVCSADGLVFQQKILPYTNLSGNTGGVIITLVDLTERCLIEKRLAESEAGYRNLFESIEEGMALHRIVLDECGKPVDYIFEMFNPAFTQMTGLNEEVIGKSVREVIPDIDESLIETYGRVAITGKSEIIEYFMPQYSRWYHIKAYCPEKLKFVCLCTDITDFKESQKNLLNNKLRFRAFFEQVNVIVFRCDTEMSITDINREAELCYGISRDQARGKSFFELFITQDDDRDLARDIQDKVLQGYPVYGMVNSITRADGQKLTLQWNSVREVDPEGAVLGIIVTARDITEEARMQDKLIEREELFRSIFEESPIGIELFNASGKLMHINKAFVEILGISGDVSRFYDMNLFDEPELSQAMVDLVNSGQTVRYETKYDLERYRQRGLVSSSGDYVWIESHISAMYDSQRKVMGYLVQVINITQRKKALTELQENRNKLELAQRTANVGYWQWDKENDTYTFSAEAGLILNADDCETILPMSKLQELLGGDWQIFDSFNKKVWYDGIPAEFFVRIVSPNGHRDLKVNILRASVAGLGTQGTILDVTELVEARRNAELASHAKSLFLANMSHEIRTPLNVIVGFGEQLAREKLELEQKDSVNNIVRSGYELLQTVEDILDISRIEAGKFKILKLYCNLQQIIDDILIQARYRLTGKNVEFMVDVDLPASAYTDPLRLKQCLLNLVNNAIKFTESGYIKLLARKTTCQGLKSVVFEVDDSGVGVPDNKRKEIFEAFAQADCGLSRKFGGVGLGLSITKALVELLGGRVSLESKNTQGSLFRLIVPVEPKSGKKLSLPADGDTFSSAASSNYEEQVSGLTGRVLIAEDNIPNQKLIKIMINRQYPLLELEFVANGRILIDALSMEQYDLIFLDMSMPVMDGFEAIGLIREMGLKTPVIAITANAMVGDREKCLAAGCSEYISKPINQHQLFVLINTFLADPVN